MSPLAHAGDENFPDARATEQAHSMRPSVPIVEIANDTEAPGVGGPDGKAGPGNVINGAELRAAPHH